MTRRDDESTRDIDFLVRFEPGRSPFDQAGLVDDLEQLLGVDVDVLPEGTRPSADPSLLSDAIALHDEPASHLPARRDLDQRLDDLAEFPSMRACTPNTWLDGDPPEEALRAGDRAAVERAVTGMLQE